MMTAKLVHYMTLAQVVARYQTSRWTIYDRARRGLIPHRKLPGTKRLLFDRAELDRFDNGDVELERIDLPQQGRIVRLRSASGQAGAE